MKLIIDYAGIEKIKELYEYFPVSGVTTNPTILTKSGRNPYEVLKEIREFIGPEDELHAQVISTDAEGMIEEAHHMVSEIGGNFFVKIPTTREGLKAMKVLAAEGIQITATAVYTSMQAYLAGQAGACYVAPYVNRIDNLSQNGIQVVRDIQDIFDNNGMKTQILGASFKNTLQVLELAKYGVGAATVAPDVMEGLIRNDSVAMAVDVFVRDFQNAYGEGATMKNCK